jgi:hypothetical protein
LRCGAARDPDWLSVAPPVLGELATLLLSIFSAGVQLSQIPSFGQGFTGPPRATSWAPRWDLIVQRLQRFVQTDRGGPDVAAPDSERARERTGDS